MIIDRSRLAGLDAYFIRSSSPGAINLGGASAGTARSRDIGDGLQYEVSGIRLAIQAGNLLALFTRSQAMSVASGPLFSISLTKEIFPGLYADPFRHRVHSIAGFEDFSRGSATNCRAMEVEGIPTLVTTGTETATWFSPIFAMPTAMRFNSAAWDIASTRLSPVDDFSYSIALSVWTALPAAGPPALTLSLVTDIGPAAPRFVSGIEQQLVAPGATDPLGIAAYRLEFSANVKRDVLLTERHTAFFAESIGRPLLRAIHLLEPIESIYDIASLSELLGLCSEYYVPEVSDGVVTHMTALLDFPAVLSRGPAQSEFIEVAVRHDGFEAFEAMLEAEVLVRPPRA